MLYRAFNTTIWETLSLNLVFSKMNIYYSRYLVLQYMKFIRRTNPDQNDQN